MKWYGSIDNRIEEHATSCTPEIGMGVTEYCYSDRYPFEIIEIQDDRHIKVRELTATRTDDYCASETQEYEYHSDENNQVKTLFKTKKGEWRERIGRSLGCTIFRLGAAEKYFDYSF